MNPDPNINCAGAPVVTLAGREWFVPVLAMRQARVVVPALMRLMPVLQEMQSGQPGGDGAALRGKLRRDHRRRSRRVDARLSRTVARDVSRFAGVDANCAG